MVPEKGDNATTGSLPLSSYGRVLTATSRHTVGSGPDRRTGTQATDSGDSGDDRDRDRDLTANRFDIDGEIPDSGDDLEPAADELEADAMAEAVARQWGTPEGEWWP